MQGSPFKFLDSFTKEDKDIFFGRDREIEEIYSRVFQSNLLLVYGASGTGKTSLIQCGLANKFNDSDWLPILIRRGSNILTSIRAQLEHLAITPIKEGASLKKSIESLYLDHFKPVYLIFDQLEELFIFGSPDEIGGFVTEVAKILKSDLQCKFIFIIRGEYLEHLSVFEEKVPEFFSNRIRIEKMTRLHAAEAITGPCRKANIGLDPGFELNFLEMLCPGKAEVELTYLQVFLDKLYKKAVQKNAAHPVFTNGLLKETGQISDVLSDFLEEQIARIPDSEAALAVLKSFVSMEGTKRQVDIEEIEKFVRTLGKQLPLETIEKLVHQFVDLRILRDKDESGKYELRHDSLAVKIYEKITLVEKDLIEVKTLIENAYSNYLKRHILIHESDLAYIAPYERNLFLSEKLQQFLDDSKRASTQTKRRRRLALFIVTGVAFAVLSGFTIWAMSERTHAMEQSHEAEKQKMLAEQEKNEALRSKDEAVKANEQVMQEKLIAEKNEQSALAAKQLADKAKQQAMTAMNEAEREKGNAMSQSEIAKKEALNAEAQKEIAKKEKTKAEESEKKARKSFVLSLAQGIALKTPLYKNDLQLEALLAYQAYKLNKDNNGPAQDPVIFDALRSALGAPDKQKVNPDIGFVQTNEFIALQERNDTLVYAARSGFIFGVDKNKPSSFTIAKLLSYRFSIDKLFFNATGNYIVSSHVNNSLCLWTQQLHNTAPAFQELTGHKGLVRSLAFNTRSDLFASGGKDSLLIIWSLQSGKAAQLKTIKLNAAVKKLVFSKDESQLFCLLENGTIQQLDLKTYTYIPYPYAGTSKPMEIALNRKKNKLLLGLANGNLWSEDLDTHTHSDYRAHLSGIDFLVFNKDYSMLASAGSDRTLKIYDADNLESSPISIKDLHSKARAIIFTTGNQLFVACADIKSYLIETSCDRMAASIYQTLKRNMTQDEWAKFCKDVTYEKTRPDLP